MIDLLKQLLVLREALNHVSESADSVGYLEDLPEIWQMQQLERKVLEKVNEFSKSDPKA